MGEEALRRNFGKVHALHVAALARHLIACRKVCDGDLDLFLVLTCRQMGKSCCSIAVGTTAVASNT